MSEVLVAALKVAFLALIWLFIWFAANVIRTDMFGRSIPDSSPELAEATPKQRRQRRARKRQHRDQPTRLAVTEGRSSGTSVALADRITIGRSSDCSITIDDDYSSTQHAELAQNDNGEWILTDLRSTNGTYVNGVRITNPTRIERDDVVRIGRTQLRLET